jgi:hypothetical protein
MQISGAPQKLGHFDMGRLAPTLVAFALFIGVSHAQSPLNPPGWSDLYTQSRTVGLWINAQRMCGIEYDPVKLEAQIHETAEIFDLSVAELKSEGQKRADEAVPHVTDRTCRAAREQAKRLGILAGYRPPPPSTPPATSLAQ